MATITDVAEKAGVFTTTVSHVINQTRFVSEELTRRVYQAMEALDYHPNSLARSLRSGQTKTIGLIVPDISNLFFAEIARSIEDRGLENEHSVILCNADNDVEKEARYIDVLIAKQVDGIIFISSGSESQNLKKLVDFGIPVVVADRDLKGISADVVLVDNRHGGYLATRHLISLGHRHIACITGPSQLTPSSQRIEGYRLALKEFGLEDRAYPVAASDFSFQGGEKAMNGLLEAGGPPPTAVFACNDMMALGAIRAIYNHGLIVPEDISVVGFDDIPISQCVYPAITTVAQPMRAMGQMVVDLLIQQIAHKADRRNQQAPNFRRIVLETQLVERHSCKALA